MIELKNFSKTYKSLFKKEKVAVSDISFIAPNNSITGLLGPNGAGKTTIIKAICAIHYATSGNVFVYDKNGQKFDTCFDVEKSKKLIGYVSETPHLYKNFLVIEYLKMIESIWQEKNFSDKNSASNNSSFKNSSIKKSSSKNSQLEKIIKDFKLEKVLTQKISTLSKGYCQRVSFASALIHNPEILILDEPSSGLDPNQIIETRELIKKLSSTKTILLSTHIMSEAENLCDNVVILSDGKMCASGLIDDVKKISKAKTLEEAYINLTRAKKEI